MATRPGGGGGLAELGAREIVFEHVRIAVEVDRRQLVVGERHESRGHVHGEIGWQQRRREAGRYDVGGRRGTRRRRQRIRGGGKVAQKRHRVVVSQETDGGRGGRTLAARAANAQQVGRVFAEQRVHVVGSGRRQAASQRGQVGRHGRRRGR